MNELVRASLALAALTLAGCAYGPDGGAVGETGQVQVLASASLPEPSTTDMTGPRRSSVIGPQDTLQVDVFGMEGMSDREIVVDSAGRISIPLAGSLEAAGSTPEEVAALIAERLQANYVREPQVSVNIKEVASRFVTIDGQVVQPGMYPVIGDMTLLRAVANAKGMSEFAKLDDVLVFRTVGGQRYVGVYNLAAIRRGNYPDPAVYANDVVVVGDSTARRRLKDFMTILPAITSPLIYLLAGNN